MKYDSGIVNDDKSVQARGRQAANRRKGSVDCTVCCGLHDDGIHDATVSVHEWFRGRVTRGFVTALPPVEQILAR
jgi:hypothetical protein